MDALFLIDRDARQRELSAAERLAQRHQYAEEWLTAIHETSLWLSRQTLPKSALGQAITYTLNQWPKLRLYLAPIRSALRSEIQPCP